MRVTFPPMLHQFLRGLPSTAPRRPAIHSSAPSCEVPGGDFLAQAGAAAGDEDALILDRALVI